MLKNKNYPRRLVITAVIVLTLAFAGLLAANVGRVTAGHGDRDVELKKTDSGISDLGAVTPVGSSIPLASIIKMLSALTIVIFCVYFGLYFLKRLIGGRRAAGGREHLFEVIQSTYVGPKKSVALLRVADRSVLIGVTDSRISMLMRLDPDETAAILAQETKKRERNDFGAVFSAAAKKIRTLNLKRSPGVLES